MSPRHRLSFASALASLALFTTSATAASVEIHIDATKPTVPLSPHLYGLFFEDINFGADGGLYAELVQNRSFEYSAIHGGADPRGRTYDALTAWEKVARHGAGCDLTVESARPLNPSNPHYLKVKIARATGDTAASAGTAGVRNSGFDGIRIDSGALYDVSLYARTADWSGEAAVTVAIELPDGTIAGSTRLTGLGADWEKLSGSITAIRTADDARLVVTTEGRGTLDLDMVSLFPQDTWLGRKNGLRKDLVEALKNLNPKFLRFPGGCIAHGAGLDNAYSWKNSVGDVAERKPNWNLWGYHQTLGLGYYEYFLLCEDLGMQPLPVVPVGVSCSFRHLESVPMHDLQGPINDALDLIEFANGPADSKWGAVRAKMGHPKPFGLQFVCLGNEEGDTREVRERFPHFVEAIRKAHPEINIIGTSGLGAEVPLYDMMSATKVYSSDEHYYEAPEWFIEKQNRFDTFPRGGPKLFIGEYASRGSTLFNAVAEAAYLTGVERNGDLVDMTCYAPLFAHLDHTQWNPDLIYFNKRAVVLTANYHVQQLFAQNKGDAYVSSTITTTDDKPATVAGEIGVGSWKTAIEVARITVDGRDIAPSDWRVTGGRFHTANGAYVQSSTTDAPALSTSPASFTGETVTYTVRARKTGGEEGFLIRFGGQGGEGGYWWNVGGWGNKRHGIERLFPDGAKSTIASTAGTIETGVWYDLSVVLSPGRIQCSINGKVIHDYNVAPPSLSVSTALDRSTREVIVKLVNPTPRPVDARVSINGIAGLQSKGRLTTLTGDPRAVNTVQNPAAVAPTTSEIPVSGQFTHQIPATSVQFLRIKAR